MVTYIVLDLQRLKKLTEEIKANGWACKLQTVEVGARGIYNYSLQTFMNHLNVKTKEKKKACMKIAEISLRASYTIYLSRNTTIWTDDWELVKRLLWTNEIDCLARPLNRG